MIIDDGKFSAGGFSGKDWSRLEKRIERQMKKIWMSD
jgi:hypothetical protein